MDNYQKLPELPELSGYWITGWRPWTVIAVNILYSGDSIYSDQSLNYGTNNLVMQENCNLVLYINGATGTAGSGTNFVCTLPQDGELMVHDGSTIGSYVLLVQPDGNVVIYGNVIWSSNTDRYPGPGAGQDALTSLAFPPKHRRALLRYLGIVL
ncbi:hypothetical protein AMTRI_Chr08g161290 [Amborella trichopoda]